MWVRGVAVVGAWWARAVVAGGRWVRGPGSGSCPCPALRPLGAPSIGTPPRRAKGAKRVRVHGRCRADYRSYGHLHPMQEKSMPGHPGMRFDASDSSYIAPPPQQTIQGFDNHRGILPLTPCHGPCTTAQHQGGRDG